MKKAIQQVVDFLSAAIKREDMMLGQFGQALAEIIAVPAAAHKGNVGQFPSANACADRLDALVDFRQKFPDFLIAVDDLEQRL